MGDSVLFVFYNIKGNSTWVYPKLPNGWAWSGAGNTTPIVSDEKQNDHKYKREEQFNGPVRYKASMRNYLYDYFKNLQKDNKITEYKIADRYDPD